MNADEREWLRHEGAAEGTGSGMSEHLDMAITDEASLLAATDWLHDGTFDPNDAEYDSPTATFILTMWREADTQKVPTRIPFIHRTVTTWARCRLTLRRVERVELHPQGIWPIFNEVKYLPDRREIRFWLNDMMDLAIQVEKIEGELEDTGETALEPATRHSPSSGEGPKGSHLRPSAFICVERKTPCPATT